jgi:DNA-binding MarR family transcriptional regulator
MKSKEERKEDILNSLPIKERDLYRKLRIDNSFCSKLLKELSQEGMIEIEELHDRAVYGRCKRIVLTIKGRQELGVKEMIIQKENNIEEFSNFSPERAEREILMRECGLW